MSLDQLDDWLDTLDPLAKVDGASMLDGYVTAIVIGPCSIPPDEWFVDLFGARGRIATAQGKTLAAMTAVVARFNAISETLSTAPGQHAPIFEKTECGLALPHPWCMGFLSAMQLRLKDWQPLLDPSRPDHALYVKCREQSGREASPTAAVIDSQSVKSAEKGGTRSIRTGMTPARRLRARSDTSWSIHRG